jgi:hypothetical protein
MLPSRHYATNGVSGERHRYTPNFQRIINKSV